MRRRCHYRRLGGDARQPSLLMKFASISPRSPTSCSQLLCGRGILTSHCSSMTIEVLAYNDMNNRNIQILFQCWTVDFRVQCTLSETLNTKWEDPRRRTRRIRVISVAGGVVQ
ncbi:uncharacterized protein CANTADRAFT_313406 [Suhomyces tanzawaensis NRRL Y-17324]|uniref:Uncharacterized protein n=1 Tax=Suhomyces tanzawaensis NRRL Y-17324 TaxID=984487 RepID=A0A1E4SDC9_9ASCO|nr:uncharacterized protein CANTADRAFT_313406 [Suhomyces tanzawaensis NRRL Y-17324]ODV77520.1 hypothetical protein CANTADRAFT_313406 [Suhomyces tanzawaensis NRRL Y-17324]